MQNQKQKKTIKSILQLTLTLVKDKLQIINKMRENINPNKSENN